MLSFAWSLNLLLKYEKSVTRSGFGRGDDVHVAGFPWRGRCNLPLTYDQGATRSSVGREGVVHDLDFALCLCILLLKYEQRVT